MPVYEVRYVDRQRPANRDAVVLALRVTRDGAYFQFVEAIVSGIALAVRKQSSVSEDRFWAWFARDAVRLVHDMIDRGELPLDDPMKAAFVAPDLNAVVLQCESETIEALGPDCVVARFEA